MHANPSHANPSTLAGRGPRTPLTARVAASPEVVRRPTRGDLLTVDPQDRRRRAQAALLELVVTRSVERRRG